MDNYIGAFSEKALNQLPRPEVGETALNTDTQKICVYDGTSWVSMPKEQLELQLLELNRNLMSQMPFLTEEQKKNKANLFNNFIAKTKNKFYMLYGKEINYFSLFMKDNENSNESFFEAFQDCLDNLADNIYSIDTADDNNNAIEIWIKVNDKTTFLYFFPYDLGVIPFREG